MKKSMLISLITICTLAAFGTLCLAQTDRTVTNTSKKGSLVIWPLIKVGPGDTTVQLSNNYYGSVKVKCAYRFPFASSHQDWVFTLKPNQSLAWLASTGKGPDGKDLPVAGSLPPSLSTGTMAELSCWAVDSAGSQQIAWNWLAGDAIVGEGNDQNWEYSAWRFAVNSSTTGSNAGSPGKIMLTGDSGNYDACPTSLLFNFLRQTNGVNPTKQAPRINDIGGFPPGTVNARLTLVPCSQDLKGDSNFVAYTALLTRNEDGATQPTASTCVGSGSSGALWFCESLSSSKLRLVGGVNPFVNLDTPGGSIVVHGRVNASCGGSIGTPLIGVMSMQFSSNSGPVAGGAPTGVGPGQGYIRNASDVNTTNPVSIDW